MYEIKNIEMKYSSRKKVLQIYKATVDDEQCYYLEHMPSKKKRLFEYDETAKNGVIEAIEKQRVKVIKGRFKALENTLWSLYYDEEYNPHKKIGIRNAGSEDDSILDLRKENLFYRGGVFPESTVVESRPGYPEEKYIFVPYEGMVGITEYDETLNQILITRNLSDLDRTGNRLRIWNNCNPNDGIAHHFGTFIMVFQAFKDRYQSHEDAAVRFMMDYPTLQDEFMENKVYQCGHIKDMSWLCIDSNMMKMKSEANRAMQTYASAFTDVFDLLPIKITENGKEIIIAEFHLLGDCLYFRFETAEQYATMLKDFMEDRSITMSDGSTRSSLFGHTRFGHCWISGNERREVEVLSTPNARWNEIWNHYHSRSSIQMDLETTQEVFWDYCERRDALKQLYIEKPEWFSDPWKSGNSNEVTDGVVRIPQRAITDIMLRYPIDGLPLRGTTLPDGREVFMQVIPWRTGMQV